VGRKLNSPFQIRTREHSSLKCNGFISNPYIFLNVCVGKSTFVPLTLLMPALASPHSDRFCRCAEIILQDGCQVANRVTDVNGESIIQGITSEISRQQAGRLCALVNIKWFDFNKRSFFFCNFELVYLPCRLHPP